MLTSQSFSLTQRKPLSRLDLTVTEHRKSQRFDLRLPLEVVRSGNLAVSVNGQTLNLSSSGVLFETLGLVEIGEVIEYYITLPRVANHDQEVRLRCVGKITRTFQHYAAATMERYEFVRHRPALAVDSALASEAAAG
ncbi:MAG: hypothetical protein OHK0021_11680 [Bryobacter sp.]